MADHVEKKKKEANWWLRKFMREKVGDGQSPPPDTIDKMLSKNVIQDSICQVGKKIINCTRKVVKITFEFAKKIISVSKPQV